jgi:hypothetical protein
MNLCDRRGWRRHSALLGLLAALAAAVVTVPIIAPGPALAAACPGASYQVVRGDSWSAIAARHSTSMSSLLSANNASATQLIHPGQTLCLPAGVSALATTTTTTVPTSTTAPSTTTPLPPVVLAQFPVQGNCWFTDTWGAPRSGGRKHEGVDIIAAANKFVYAVADGTLTRKYVDTPGALAGNGWRLTAPNGTYFFYAHFSAFAPNLAVGSTVKAGQVIGFIGQTGNAGTPHLHFEIHPGGGAAVNPTPAVKAVDGCKVTTPPAQPGGNPPPSVPPPTSPTTTTTSPGAPTTSAPSTTVPGTTVPPGSTTPPPTANGHLWRFIAPVLATDAALTANTAKSVTTTSLAGVPAGTASVIVRVVPRNVTTAGYLVVAPCGATTSGATLVVHPDRAAATTTPVALTNGGFCVTSSVRLNVRIDVIAVAAAGGVGVDALVPVRALDTRTGTAAAANSTRVLSPKTLGIPTGSSAVTVTVTVLNPAATGSIGLAPCGGSAWIVPFKLTPLQQISGVVRVNDAGLCISTTASAQIVVDVSGVWRGTNPLTTTGQGPARGFDSRRSTGLIGAAPVLAPLTGVPATATTAQLVVSVINPNATGNAAVFVWPCAAPKPAAAAVAVGPNSMSTASVTSAVKAGSLCVASTAPAQVIIDVVAMR